MNVFIITEGGSDRGFGHISRCTSIYQAFQERDICPEFVVNGDESVEALLADKRHKILNWMAKWEEVLGLINGADAVIIDSYLAPYELYESASHAARLCAYVDDNRRLDYPTGIVVNGTILAEEIPYPQKKGMIYLLGKEYILLRRVFWDVPEKEIKETVESILVTLGGNDIRNMTPKILEVLTQRYPKVTKIVTVGSGFKNRDEIEKAKDNNTHLINAPEAEMMKEAMLRSDIAISAGGQTLNELARVGVPTIALAIADNQMNNVKGWQRAGFIEYAGSWEDKKCLESIEEDLKFLADKSARARRARVGRASVDGQGHRRVAEKILTLSDKWN
jgi:UDP-2,4-diacetamido-2,4,6-trideoxy-beta-L-altropyranose hydrolase